MTLKRKIIAILSISAVFIACVCLAFSIKTSVYAEYSLSNVNYKETYAIGDTLPIQSAKIIFDNKEYQADAIVHFPDGTKKQLQEITFDKSGNYVIEYRSVVDGKVLFKTVNFSVESNVFSIDGKGSVSYGTNSYFTDNIKGVNVTMSRGSVLTYNKVINLSDNDKNSAPVLRIYATPEVVGVAEIDTLKVTLTDVYDSENYVEFRYKYQDGHIYIAGNAKGQPASGLEGHSKLTSNTIIYDGNYYRLWQKHLVYGYSAKTSFTGLRKIVDGLTLPTFEDNYCELSVDYADKKFYGQSPWTGVSKLIIDLDEPMFFGDNLWEGFTTGEAILSITSVGSSSNFNCFITEIDGHNLSSTLYNQQTEPVISVDTLDYEQDDLPNAIVGKNYPVFESSAIATGGANVVSNEVFVYHNYENSSRSPIDIVDGYFKPLKAGNYTLVYKAVDSNGGESIKTLNVLAITRNALEYQLDTSTPVTFSVGAKVNVKDVSFSNALDGYSLTATACLKGGDVSYEIKDGSFVPLYSGKYDIKYTYQDIVESIDFSYEVTVKATNVPVFASNPVFPRYYIKNCTYNLDKISAYDFSNGTNLVPASIYVSQDGQTELLLSSNSYKVTANSSVVVSYKVTTNNETVEIRSSEIPVIDVGYGLTGKDATLDMSKYLQSGEFSLLQKTKSNIVYTVDKNSAVNGNATLSAINEVYTQLFNLEFTVDATVKAYEKIQVILTDVYDANKKVTLTFSENSNGCGLTVENGVASYSGQTDNKFDGLSKFLIEVQEDTLTFSNSKFTLPIEKVFAGFSDRVYLDIKLVNVTGQSNFIVSRINGQGMTDSRFDSTAPKLIYDEILADYSIGDVVTISPFMVYDFVDPSCRFSYYVMDKDGNYVTSDEGVLLDGSQDFSKSYKLTLNGYVNYSLYGEAFDFTPTNKTRISRSVYIVDKVLPTIELDVKQNVFALGEITLATYNASDDRSDVTVDIVVYMPNAKVVYCENGKFNATIKGEHKAVYRATDQTGNVCFVEYVFMVK